MDPQLIQFLAALANGRSRARFAQVALAGHDGVPSDERQDRLLLSVGVLSRLPQGRVAVDDGALHALLAQVRAARPAKPQGKLDLLPRQRRPLLETLRVLGGELLGPGEEVSERDLNERLAERVEDVPRVRRALVDEGILARERDGSRYWLV
jgi:hypothetical protein